LKNCKQIAVFIFALVENTLVEKRQIITMSTATAVTAANEALDPQRLRDLRSRVDNLRGYL
jgi:hypothetical protein